MISQKWDNWLTGSRMIRSAFSYSRQATEKYKFVSDTSKMLEIHPKASFTKYYCQGRWKSEKSLKSKFFSSVFFFFYWNPLVLFVPNILNIYQTTQIKKNYFFFSILKCLNNCHWDVEMREKNIAKWYMHFLSYTFIDFIEDFFFVKLAITVINACLCHSYLHCNFSHYFEHFKIFGH